MDLKMSILIALSLLGVAIIVFYIVRFRKTYGIIRILLVGFLGNIVFSVVNNVLRNTWITMGISLNGWMSALVLMLITLASLWISYSLVKKYIRSNLSLVDSSILDSLSYNLSGIAMAVFSFINYTVFLLNIKMDSLSALASDSFPLSVVEKDAALIMNTTSTSYIYLFMNSTLIPICLFFLFFSGYKMLQGENKKGWIQIVIVGVLYYAQYFMEIYEIGSIVKIAVMLGGIVLAIGYAAYSYKKGYYETLGQKQKETNE